ncbi:LytR/AlgR family response regulator transcription factor [Spirosoma foliorum]|uniref:Response regulator transcription factor n=1 Tax=Spirosoma foliorum TaxID=2710596 RepID=A0A7G5H0T1_9BACT|nr:LytTR family DNA-binding domain-containing protein [Spirosoma foliorum]QMW04723.1 response regulator transcription factor [Spirosoma foliorum]
MNVVIIEDESLSVRRLEKMLSEYDPTIQVLAKLPSVTKALRWFNEHQAELPDLIFMDIHLEDDSAFRIIEETQLELPIIFTTAYDQYTLQAFKANSIDYLLKPIDTDELGAALDKFKRVHLANKAVSSANVDALIQSLRLPSSVYKDRFMVTIGTKIQSIQTDQIAYFFYDEKSTWLQTHDGRPISVEYSLEKLATLLDPNQFFRINRAYLITFDAIKTIHTDSSGKLKLDLEPISRHEVFVSGDRVTDFKAWLGK